ncbi:MAG: hypothetical protein KAR42_02800 [candidate division Zixibacteria bacterium]|nr:hypothetical protein [candidate division Zixibacteria bacterium]
MRKLFVLLLVMLASLLFLIQCSDDKTTGPTDQADLTDPAIIEISGITRTGIFGVILRPDSDNPDTLDADDWCYTSTLQSTEKKPIPNAFALYPAFPNSSYQQVIVRYDIPVASDVDIYIIDTTQTVIKELVSEQQQAGGYTIYWDRTDTSGVEVPADIYRLMMKAGDFECYGDIKLTEIVHYPPNSDTIPSVTIELSINGNNATISYSSDVELGGFAIRLPYTGTYQNLHFDIVARKMEKSANTINSIINIVITPSMTLPLEPLATLPAGQDVTLCTFSFTGDVFLGCADASDAGEGNANIVKTILVNP